MEKLKGLDSIVITSDSGMVICIIGMDNVNVCIDGYKINLCKNPPEFRDINGKVFLDKF